MKTKIEHKYVITENIWNENNSAKKIDLKGTTVSLTQKDMGFMDLVERYHNTISLLLHDKFYSEFCDPEMVYTSAIYPFFNESEYKLMVDMLYDIECLEDVQKRKSNDVGPFINIVREGIPNLFVPIFMTKDKNENDIYSATVSLDSEIAGAICVEVSDYIDEEKSSKENLAYVMKTVYPSITTLIKRLSCIESGNTWDVNVVDENFGICGLYVGTVDEFEEFLTNNKDENNVFNPRFVHKFLWEKIN